MKVCKNMRFYLSVVFLGLCVVGCASTEEGAEGDDLEASNANAENVADADLNQNSGDVVMQGAGDDLAQQGEAVNNATDQFEQDGAADQFAQPVQQGQAMNDFSGTNGNVGANTQAPADAPNAGMPMNVVNGIEPQNVASPQNGTMPPTNAPVANVAATPQNNAAQMPVASAGEPVQGWDGRGRVKYAKRYLSKRQGPQGPEIGGLEKGDHPLVLRRDGSWDILSNGSYVESEGLSERGIGRDRRVKEWRQ